MFWEVLEGIYENVRLGLVHSMFVKYSLICMLYSKHGLMFSRSFRQDYEAYIVLKIYVTGFAKRGLPHTSNL